MADPITYVFLLTLWTADVPHAQVYVEDTGLSGSDCITAMDAYNEANPTWTKGNPSCEIDAGFLEESMSHQYAVEHNGETLIMLPCEYEDSDNCVWDAPYRGNGQGQSFYALNGQVYYVETWEP